MFKSNYINCARYELELLAVRQLAVFYGQKQQRQTSFI